MAAQIDADARAVARGRRVQAQLAEDGGVVLTQLAAGPLDGAGRLGQARKHVVHAHGRRDRSGPTASGSRARQCGSRSMSATVCTGMAVSWLVSMMATFSASVREAIASRNRHVELQRVLHAGFVGRESRIVEQSPRARSCAGSARPSSASSRSPRSSGRRACGNSRADRRSSSGCPRACARGPARRTPPAADRAARTAIRTARRRSPGPRRRCSARWYSANMMALQA